MITNPRSRGDALSVQRSFAGGEITPALYARADVVKFTTGLRTCRNFQVMRHGGAATRPGTEFVCARRYADRVTRLIPFVFNAEQTYVLEFGHLYLRVVRNGVQLEASPGVPYEIATPYAETDLAALQFVQSADVVTLVHPSHAPRELARTGHTAWTLSVVSFVPQTAAPTGLGGSGSAGSESYTYHVTAVAADTGEESLAATVTVASVAVPTTAAPITLSWTASPDAQTYNVYREANGIGGFIGVAGAVSFKDQGQTADFNYTPPIARTVFAASGDYPGTTAYYQQRQLFAGTDNDPEQVLASRIGDFHNFASRSPLQADDAVLWTLAGQEVNAVRHLLALRGLTVLTSGGGWTIKGDGAGVLTPYDVNPEQFDYSGASTLRPLIVGSTALYQSAEGNVIRDLRYSIEADGLAGKDLTIFATHLFEGYDVTAWAFQKVPDSIIWARRTDGTLLGLTYVPDQELWGWHRHDTAGEFEDVVAVPENGKSAVYVATRRYIDGAWVRYLERFAQRAYTDIAVDAFFVDCGLSYDGRNADPAHTMTLSGGSTWAHTEALTLTSSASYFSAGEVGNAIHLKLLDADPLSATYGAVTDTLRCEIIAYTSATVVTVRAHKDVPAGFQAVALADWARAVDELAGLEHLEGRALAVLGDGNVVANGLDAPLYTVSAGAVTLGWRYEVIHAGLPYTADLETLELDKADQALLGLRKRVSGITVALQASRGLWAGPDAAHLREWAQRSDEAPGEPTRPFTGRVELPIGSTWNNSGRVLIRQRDPLPLSVLAIEPYGDMGG